MVKPRVLILRAPGTNCDVETAHAFELAGAETATLHINRVLEQPRTPADFQILCLPGGFSYGDDVAAGRILGSLIQHHLADALNEFRDEGKLILGICNGFQVLIKSGMLLQPSATETHPQPGGDPATLTPATLTPATLTWNDSGKFEDRWVYLAVHGNRSVFLAGITELYLPVAHAEGKFVTRDASTLGSLDQSGQLVLRYCHPKSGTGASVAYPHNPNGSQLDVAGVCDTTGRVLGLMPHPERHVDRTHHPRWTRGEGQTPGDGLAIFQNAVRYFR